MVSGELAERLDSRPVFVFELLDEFQPQGKRVRINPIFLGIYR
jgi:hypothetical protein